MIFADVAPSPGPGFRLAALACLALSCMFVISAILLTVVLVRRNRRGRSS